MVAGNYAASASFDKNWRSIDWDRCQRSVLRLQARIVQATQGKRWNKVRALQHLLTRSFSAKALAVKRVTTNKGKYTPGVDGQIWQTTTDKYQAIENLRQRGYAAQPLRRVFIPKSATEKRPLGIPTMKDRAMQALYLMGVEPVAETTGDQHSYGFRRHRCAADAINQVHKTLAGAHRATWILEGDIKGCFDEISHEWLAAKIPMEKRLLHKWLKAGVIEKRRLYPTERGTPQGGIISPVLANMTLDGLEGLIDQYFGKKGSKKRKHYGVHLVRYADDFIVTSKTKELLVTKVKPLIESFLAHRGLKLSEKKTVITHVDEGFDFLGQHVRKYKKRLLIKPSQKSIHRLLNSVKTMIKKNRASTQSEVITMLNPQIRGWANYHRTSCARKVFEKVDHEIFGALWRWAKRRHPNKGLQWIKEKYFKVRGSRQWCFGTMLKKKNKREWLELFLASNVSIRRHIKIRCQANPYDRDWYPYFKERLMGPRTLPAQM